MFKSGIYTAVPLPNKIVNVSQKAAFGAKRAMDEHWKYDKIEQEDTALRYAASKVSRGQLGEPLHECWLKDMVKSCGTKVLLVNAFASGSHEIEAAAIRVTDSTEAANSNVKVCTWSYEPRKVFYDVGRARVLTSLGKAYMDRKIQIPGHVPVPDPGEKPERSRKCVKALLGDPLKLLHVDPGVT